MSNGFQGNLGFAAGGNSRMYGYKSHAVVALVHQSAGTYNDQYCRPIHSHMDGHHINQMETVLNDSKVLGSGALAGLALDILKPKASPEGLAMIPYGWSTQRRRFRLHIQFEDLSNIVTNHYYTGYSEHVGEPSLVSGLIDPKMLFTINNVDSTQTVRMETNMGTKLVHQPLTNAQVVTPSAQTSSFGIASKEHNYSLRPESVVDDMTSMDLRSQQHSFKDLTTAILAPQLSARQYNAAPQYMSMLLSNYRNTVIGEPGDSADAQLDHLKSLVKSDRYNQDPFLEFLLSYRTNNPQPGVGPNQFTLDELVRFDPNAGSKIENLDLGGFENNFHMVGRTEGQWGSSTITAQTAATIAAALPTYMSRFNIHSLGFTSTNMSYSGEIVTTWVKVDSQNNGVDNTAQMEALKAKLNNELILGLTNYGRMPFYFKVMCHLIGETYVSVSLAQQPAEEFVTPTFCDSVFSPMVSQSARTLNGLSDSFKSMFDLIDRNVHSGTTFDYALSGGGGVRSPGEVDWRSGSSEPAQPSSGFGSNQPPAFGGTSFSPFGNSKTNI